MSEESDSAAVFVLMTEDTSGQAHDTLKRITRHLLRVIRENLRTNRLCLKEATKGEHPMLAANRWKSSEPRDEPKIRELCRSIATMLERAKNGVQWFVLFHYDGGSAWSQRASCDNATKFGKRIRAGVRHALCNPPQRLPVQRKGTPAVALAATKSPEEIDLLLQRLIEVVPFYSIEAWLFRNVEVAKTHCLKHCGGAHITLLEAWQSGHQSLDEVSQPKEKLCFRDQANAELAGPGFPATDLHLAETSFYETVERLRHSPGLVTALEQTEQG